MFINYFHVRHHVHSKSKLKILLELPQTLPCSYRGVAVPHMVDRVLEWCLKYSSWAYMYLSELVSGTLLPLILCIHANALNTTYNFTVQLISTYWMEYKKVWYIPRFKEKECSKFPKALPVVESTLLRYWFL